MDMPTGTPVTFFEREKIEVWLRMDKKKTWIARKLGRDYTIIKREIKRNTGEHRSYVAKLAQQYAERRKRKTNKRKLEKWQNVKLKEFVEKRLLSGDSPEEIAGRLKEQKPGEMKGCKDSSVSHEAIYQYIYQGEGRFGGFYKKLRRKQRVRRPKRGRKKQKVSIPGRVSIHARPALVEERKRVGDWETDTVVFSKQKSCLSVQYERKTLLCRLHKVGSKGAEETEMAIQDSINSLPRFLWQTITRDNGKENVLHRETEVPSYFCDPYKSWQKGGVENLNGLIREYFPKDAPFDTISEKEVALVEALLNNRPRKRLHYLTPNEAIAREFKKGL